MKSAAIINSRSNTAARARMSALLQSKLGIDTKNIIYTERAGHARQSARQLSQRGCDLIIACGGDGTVNEIINGMDLRKCALAVVPMGTANDLANLYHIPNDPGDAISIISSGRTHKQDLISVNGWKYCTVGGMGLGVHAIHMTDALRYNRWTGSIIKEILGWRIYGLGLLLALLNPDRRRITAILQQGGIRMKGVYHAIVVGNQAVLGNRFRVLPDAVNDDGCFEAFTISAEATALELLSIIYGVLRGAHMNSTHVRYLKCTSLLLETDKPFRFFADGEMGIVSDRLDVEIMPRVLEVIVPEDWADCSKP